MKKQMRPNTAATNITAKQDIGFGSSMSSIALSTQTQRNAGNSLEGGKSGRSMYSSTSSVISMSKKQNNIQVYGSEAGLKSVTKNPWAKNDAPAGSNKSKPTISSAKIHQEGIGHEGGIKGNPSLNDSQKHKEGNTTKQRQPGVLTIPKGGISVKKNSSNISQNSSLPAKQQTISKGASKDPEKQERLSGLKDQTSIFGAFQNLSLKYAEDSDERDTNEDLAKITKISQLGKQLCISQTQKLKQEKELLVLNYEQFLSGDFLQEKDKLVSGLSDYLTKAQNLSNHFEDVSNARTEMGNYVRIPIEARSTFFDVIKSQVKKNLPENSDVTEDKDTLKNKEDEDDDNNNINDFQAQRNKKKVNLNIWGTAAPLFDFQNQIAFTEQAESLVEYMRNQISDLQQELENIKQTEEIL